MNRVIYVIFILLIFSMLAFAEDVEILTQNSYFEEGLEGWEVYLEGGAQMEAVIDDSDSVKGSQCVYLDIQQLGSDAGFWEVKLGQVILGTIEQGTTLYSLVVGEGRGNPSDPASPAHRCRRQKPLDITAPSNA